MNSFVFNKKSFTKLEFKTEKPDKEYPNTCLYIVDKKSVGQGNNIVNFEYFNKSTLMATKMTGSYGVPAGEKHLRFDMITHDFQFQYAYGGFRIPSWEKDNYILEHLQHDEISLQQHAVSDLYIHVSQFHPDIIGKS